MAILAPFPNGKLICAAGNAAHIALGIGLSLVDVSFLPNRKLVERFELSYDATRPFDFSASNGKLTYTLQEALTLCGYSGAISSLSDVHMALFDTSSATAILQQSQPARDTGGIHVRPARLKEIVAGDNITVLLGEEKTQSIQQQTRVRLKWTYPP